jgi:hypothetical protein
MMEAVCTSENQQISRDVSLKLGDGITIILKQILYFFVVLNWTKLAQDRAERSSHVLG